MQLANDFNQESAMFHLNKFILMSLLMMWVGSSYATCYKITSTDTTVTSPYYTEPGKGTVSNWDGATDSSGSKGTLPTVVNINNSTFQPDGSIISVGIQSFLNSGSSTYTSDQILFRCSADESGKLYEYYATNGDSTYAGMNEVGSSAGITGAYQTYATGMAIRATNLSTGEYYSRYWKARSLTNLDTDSLGWILVKAKNFSNTKIELFRLSASLGGWSGTGIYPFSQPSTYIAFQGGGISSGLTVGGDSLSQSSGWYVYWPGAVNLYNALYIRRSATCSVTNVTPTVIFPVITVAELNSGVTRKMPFSIQFSCQTGAPASNNVAAFANGIAENQTAMGILANSANASTAIVQGFGTAGGGVSYLLSDGYGTDSTVASGVGIQISRSSGSVLNLLSTLSGPVLGGNGAGWYSVLDDATANAAANGVTSYTKTLYATLTALPGKTVTAGKFKATAQIIIQVQ